MLAMRLTDTLLSGHFRGVPLHVLQAEEALQPAIGGAESYLQAKRNRVASIRNGRFDSALRALDRLMSWAKAERHEFMERLLGVAPTRRVAPVLQVEGLPDVAEIAETLDGLEEGLDIEEGVEEDEDVEEDVEEGVEVIRVPADRCRGIRSQSSGIRYRT